MHSLHDELRIEILKYIEIPFSLLLTNHRRYMISQDPYTRANRIIYKHGNALFHAVRLGRNFVSLNVVQALLGKGEIFPRYFIQRLTLQFDALDQQLIKMKAGKL